MFLSWRSNLSMSAQWFPIHMRKWYRPISALHWLSMKLDTILLICHVKYSFQRNRASNGIFCLNCHSYRALPAVSCDYSVSGVIILNSSITKWICRSKLQLLHWCPHGIEKREHETMIMQIIRANRTISTLIREYNKETAMLKFRADFYLEYSPFLFLYLSCHHSDQNHFVSRHYHHVKKRNWLFIKIPSIIVFNIHWIQNCEKNW